jgi:hypothetical protein
MAPAVRGGPIYAIALPGFVTNEHGVSFSARRALDETAELAKTKTRGYVVPRGVAGRERFQGELGRCDVALTAALAGRPVDAGMQTRLRSMAVLAAAWIRPTRRPRRRSSSGR